MAYLNVIETLRDPEVKNYFLGILKSSLSGEDKLEKFVAFFDLQGRLEERIASLGRNEVVDSPEKFAEIVSTAGQQIGAWQPEQILTQTTDCVVRAAGRILRCQHRDGGWGYLPEFSNLWGTAHCVTALTTLPAMELPLPSAELHQRVQRGVAWIERWCRGPGCARDASTYDAAVAVRCLQRIGQTGFAPIAVLTERLRSGQNSDGGWAWSFPEDPRPECHFSEVGATGMVLEALGKGTGEQLRDVVEKGLRWLASVQNEDGSWNEVFQEEPRLRSSINKTCVALNGLNAGRTYKFAADFRPHIDRGVRWISKQEKLIGDGAWGYEGLLAPHERQLTPNIVGTCIVVETLLKVQDVSLPLLSASVQWLVANQRCDPSVLEDGEWVGGDTFRITLALADYLASIRRSPLFKASVSAAPEHPSRAERQRAHAADL